MLTLDSKFSEYIGVLKAANACEEVMSFHDKMLAENPKLTVGDVYKVFYADPMVQIGNSCVSGRSRLVCLAKEEQVLAMAKQGLIIRLKRLLGLS